MRRPVWLGSKHARYAAPVAALDRNSIVYSAGVGLDATFDIALIRAVGCHVWAFDPTPDGIEYGRQVASSEPDFHFHPWGLWCEAGEMPFWRSAQQPHSASLSCVSSSAVAGPPVIGLVCTVQETMLRLRHQRIDLLKLDIELAEVCVLEKMLSDGIMPFAVCVEFHDSCGPWSASTVLIAKMELEHGYSVVARRGTVVTLLKSGSQQPCRGSL